jgi:P27 family predicted phage terminase small subunit
MKGEPEPLIAKACPDPPPFITGYAADEWWRTGPELHRLGLLTVVDIPALAAYCHSYGQWRMAAESLAKMQANDPATCGQLVRTKYGDAAVNPLIAIVRKHAGDVVRYAGEFGMTALARSRISGGNFPLEPGKFDGLLK